MIKILFVCLGNICRSPTAEGVFRHKIKQGGYDDNIHIDSAGTGAWHVGNPPDSRSRQTALKYGINLEDLRARKVARQDFADFDYLLAMDRDNMRNMMAICPPDHQHKISLLLDYVESDTSNGDSGNGEVPDPYNSGMDGFDRVYDIIERGSDGFLKYLLMHHSL